MGYTESRTVEEPIVEWIEGLGWKRFDSRTLDRDLDEALNTELLIDTILRLNPDVIKTRNEALQVVTRLRQLPNDIRGNQEFFNWIKNEASIILRAGEKSKTIRLIDYDDPENNIYQVTNQYRFKGYENIRPDILLFINGIPLILIECKTSTRGNIDYHNAIQQIQRYNREAPQLFRYLAYACAADSIHLRYGWTKPGRYARWRNGYTDPLKSTVYNLLNKETVLDTIKNFIVFETAHEEVTKKIAMQQQIEATNRIIERVLNTDTDRGLVWHTQGSGKTLTMLFTAWKLKKQPELRNPTIIVIIDRLQLQKQFRETFTNSGLPYVTWSENIEDLMNKIREQSREVIITTIQKFQDPEHVDPRDNIIVLIDEAHRTQYGKLAIRMRETYPNARIFGFTGTPIEKGPLKKSTFREFCAPDERYLHKYSIKQSIEDGSTVPIIYEPRLTREHIPKEILDEEFLKLTRDLTEEEREQVLEKSGKLKTVLKSHHRIERIAEDIAHHYTTNIEPNGFKAQLVTVDREACALYKEELDKHLPAEYSMVIYSKGQNDPELLRKHHMSRNKQLEVTRREFQKPDTMPKLLIVTDMLLTGFDAPIERAMYLDKPMRDHNLLQAIARTNRPYPGKDNALIVDYVGILNRLEDALNFEAEDIEGVATVIDELKQEFAQVIEKLNHATEPIPKEDSRRSQLAIIKHFSDEDNYKTFKDLLNRANALYEAIAPDPYLSPYLRDYTRFNHINKYYNEWLRRDQDSLKPYMEKTKRLIQESVVLTDIEDGLPILEIGSDYLGKLEEENLPVEQEVAELKVAIRHYIRLNIERNPLLESLGERLERIVRRKDPELMRKDLREMVEFINGMEGYMEEKDLSPEEHALLVVSKENLNRSDEDLIPFVKTLSDGLDDSSLVYEGWDTRSDSRDKVRRYVFNQCFQRFKDEVEGEELLALSDSLIDYIVRFRS